MQPIREVMRYDARSDSIIFRDKFGFVRFIYWKDGELRAA